MQLSKKNPYPQRFFAFLKFTWNSENFETNIALTGYVFPKTETAKHVIRQISKNSGFKIPFDSQRVKGHKTPLKSTR